MGRRGRFEAVVMVTCGVMQDRWKDGIISSIDGGSS